jgi:hydrogenase-4 transcriptional activator
MSILLDVWREACRHLDIGESVARIAPLLATRLPIDWVLVRRIDLEQRRIETVAAGVCGTEPPPAQRRTRCSAADLERVVTWCRRGAVHVGKGGAGADPLLGLVVPEGVSARVIAGALVDSSGPVGVLVLVARGQQRFTPQHERVVRSLLEPFTVALDNDLRFHEVARLREAVEADNRALLSRLERQDISESVVGGNTGLKDVMDRVVQVAPTDAPVLILGETGSGKEVVARAIHTQSRRAAGPFLRVNCGAIPSELVDSELFGHERGSFTGAVATRQGWFERADGGTLFLDELGELPAAAQVRLLRVLQDGTFERVGGQRSLTVDVRIVAATHRDVERLVAEGVFRQDLWYRISVFPIHLPPLRERIEDIPSLATHFAWRAGLRLHGKPMVPSAAAIELLVSYPWPGNVRELAAVIERAVILGDGQHLAVAQALGVSGPNPGATPIESATTATPRAATPPPPPLPSTFAPASHGAATLDGAMRRHIEEALRASLGRVEGPFGAAARLGINPHTLRGRMRKLDIDWAQFRRRRV